METEKKGVALAYSSTKKIPEIIARARGTIAERLIQIAKENNITIYKDKDLTEALSVLDVGAEVPEDLYKAMASVLAYCYRINTKFKDKLDSGAV